MRAGNGYNQNRESADISNSCQSVTIEYSVDAGTSYTDCLVTWVRDGVEIGMITHDGVVLDDPSSYLFGSERSQSTFVRPIPGPVLAGDNPHRLQLIAYSRLVGDGFFDQSEVSLACTAQRQATGSASAGGGAERGGGKNGQSPSYVFSGEFGVNADTGVYGQFIVHYANTGMSTEEPERFKCTWTPISVAFDGSNGDKTATLNGNYTCSDAGAASGSGQVRLVNATGGNNKNGGMNRGNVTIYTDHAPLDLEVGMETGSVSVSM